MSRSGYSEDCDNLNLYRGTVERALKGRRGQAFLRELAAALDALPDKILIAGELINSSGECCAIGAVCKSRSLSVKKIDYEDADSVSAVMGIARSMAAEIAYMNDEWEPLSEGVAARWVRMRKWVADNIKTVNPDESNSVRLA